MQYDSSLENIGLITLSNLNQFINEINTWKIKFILLHQKDMDSIALEYRNTYRENLPATYLINGLLIREDYSRSTPQGKLRIVFR
jgi:hypothetical protein